MNRSNFFKQTTLASAGVSITGALPDFDAKEKHIDIRIGICADLHQDIMHDGAERLEDFIRDMDMQKPHFIIQLGDFCRPYDYNAGDIGYIERV